MEKVERFTRVFSPKVWRLLGASFLLMILPVILFTALAQEVRDSETLAFDEAVLRGINSYASPTLDSFVIVLTDFGDVIGVGVLTLLLTWLLWRRHMRRRAATVIVGVVGAAALNVILKALFQRDRPELWERLVVETSNSFPSGHAMASSALAFAVIAVLWNTKYRWWAVVIGVVYTVVIGLTRLYLGVHYPTDIVAGWMVSGAWIAVVAFVLKYRRSLIARLSRRS